MLVFNILMLAVAGCWAVAAGWCLFEALWHLAKQRSGSIPWVLSSVVTISFMAIILAYAGLTGQAATAISLAGR